MTIAASSLPSSFQLSTLGVGVLATGREDLRQCIDFILRTVKGTDPLRPEFGSDIFEYIDRPLTVAIPNIKKAMFEAIDIWEPRVRIISITHEIDPVAHLIFHITYTTSDDLVELFSWTASGVVNSTAGSASGLILTALIPAKITNARYNLVFITDSKQVTPLPPDVGFETAAELLAWVSTNLSNYGRWYLTADKLVLYMNSGVAKKASLLVTQSASLTLKVNIPNIPAGEFYSIAFSVEGNAATPAFPEDTIATIEQLIVWIQNYWSGYGSWYIESDNATYNLGDFNDDFNDDFSTGDGYVINRRLVFQTKQYGAATLIFN